MLRLLRDPGVTHLGCATDHVIRSWRNERYAGYKTEAGMPPEILAQFELAEEALRAIGLVVWPMVEFEADDALATAAARWADSPGVERVVILSPDKDLAQCVRLDGRVVAFDRRRERIIDADAVRARFGVDPESIPDWLALVGDAADGFPGLRGWGERSASAVLARYVHLEAIPERAWEWDVSLRGAGALAETLRAGRAEALLYRELATLRTRRPASRVARRPGLAGGAPRAVQPAGARAAGTAPARSGPALAGVRVPARGPSAVDPAPVVRTGRRRRRAARARPGCAARPRCGTAVPPRPPATLRRTALPSTSIGGTTGVRSRISRPRNRGASPPGRRRSTSDQPSRTASSRSPAGTIVTSRTPSSTRASGVAWTTFAYSRELPTITWMTRPSHAARPSTVSSIGKGRNSGIARIIPSAIPPGPEPDLEARIRVVEHEPVDPDARHQEEPQEAPVGVHDPAHVHAPHVGVDQRGGGLFGRPRDAQLVRPEVRRAARQDPERGVPSDQDVRDVAQRAISAGPDHQPAPSSRASSTWRRTLAWRPRCATSTLQPARSSTGSTRWTGYGPRNDQGLSMIRARTFTQSRGSGGAWAAAPPDTLHAACDSCRAIRIRGSRYHRAHDARDGRLTQVTAGRAIVAALERSGIRHAFTVPGESFLELLDALRDSRIRLVAARHEAGAGFMAEAYGQLTGRPAVCLVTRAVGTANLSIALHTAVQDSTPLVAIAGQVPRGFRGREAFQEADLAGSFGALCKAGVELDDPRTMAARVERMVGIARQGRPGPVLLVLPEDALGER